MTESRWDLTAHDTSRYIASKSYYSHHVRWNHQPIITEKVPFPFIEQKRKEKPKLDTSQYSHSDDESLTNPNMWSSHPLNLLKTSFFVAKPWNLWQRLLKATPIKFHRSWFLHPPNSKQGNGAAHQKPIKRVGVVGPLLPTALAISQKIGSRQKQNILPTNWTNITSTTYLLFFAAACPYFNESYFECNNNLISFISKKKKNQPYTAKSK